MQMSNFCTRRFAHGGTTYLWEKMGVWGELWTSSRSAVMPTDVISRRPPPSRPTGGGYPALEQSANMHRTTCQIQQKQRAGFTRHMSLAHGAVPVFMLHSLVARAKLYPTAPSSDPPHGPPITCIGDVRGRPPTWPQRFQSRLRDRGKLAVVANAEWKCQVLPLHVLTRLVC